jgi:hypothetical protein
MKFNLGKIALVINGGTTLNNQKDQSMPGKNLEKIVISKCLSFQEIKMELCQLQEPLIGLTHGWMKPIALSLQSKSHGQLTMLQTNGIMELKLLATIGS